MNRLFPLILTLLLLAPLAAQADWTLREEIGQRVKSIDIVKFATAQECRDGIRVAALLFDAADAGQVVTEHGDHVQVILAEHSVYVLHYVEAPTP